LFNAHLVTLLKTYLLLARSLSQLVAAVSIQPQRKTQLANAVLESQFFPCIIWEGNCRQSVVICLERVTSGRIR